MQVLDLDPRFRYIMVVGILFCSAGCGAHATHPVADVPNPTVSNTRLARELNAATSGSVEDRCAALKRIGEHWSLQRESLPGFSDLPVKAWKTPPPSIPAGDIEAIAKLLQTALVDSDHEVREAAAVCLRHTPKPTPAVDTAIAAALKSDDGSVLWYLSQLNFE